MLTADTYTSVLTDKHHKTAEATARLVLAAAARGPKPGKWPTTGPPAKSAASEASSGPQPVRPKASRRRKMRNRASHPHATQAAPTVHTRQNQAMNAQLNGCAARDSNPEPAD